MRYQKDIVERLSLGLAGIDQEKSAAFRLAFTEPRHDLKIVAKEINTHYGQLINDVVKVEAVGVPEHFDDIPYWIEDLERAVLPVLRERAKK
ncbi:hypothetical protein pEaSNUABM29_00217 [Erwinia phage pEa_SNUABM_29]|nr:hypothetical protein pEaSNUABM29_00217 [Erwinia phage pEa_SNUABM_29]